MKTVVFALLLAAAPPMDPEQLVMAGEAYVQGGQGRKALPVLKKAIKTGKLAEKQHARALTAMGMAYGQLGENEAAIKALEDAIKLAPDDEKPYLVLGMTYDISERYQEARIAYERGVARFPKSLSLMRELGATELLLGDAVAAVEHLGKAAARDSDDPELLRDYGEALLVAGRAKEAVKVLQDARQLDGENAQVIATLGDAFASLGQTDQALEAYQTAVGLDPSNAPAWFRKGLMHSKKNDFSAAVSSYRSALKADPRHLKARTALAVVLGRMGGGKEDEALKLLKQVVDKDPGFAEAHAQMGLILEKKGDLAAAEEALARATARRDNDARLWEALARVQEARGRKKDAAASLRNAQRTKK